jgi:hypothetical protein
MLKWFWIWSLPLLLTYLWSWALLEKPPIIQILKNFSALWNPEGSLPCSQEPFSGPYPELERLSPYHPIPSYLSKIYVLQYCPLTCVMVFLVVSFLLAFPPVSYMHSSSPQLCYMPWPSHPTWLDHYNYSIWRRVQVMKLFIILFSLPLLLIQNKSS